ncbi:DUF4835 family protein [Marinoscillum sp. MHG1-6]|uniref:type IX secretion system protein PorD n=1 Tax=Marinoscillum sp. MHG1-6 TaxID=2959627 RepID=UPI00215736EA|nr:DUF4835 family protein [Marinoscillum sp. MHG1-6]
MHRYLTSTLLIGLSFLSFAQELNCKVIINAQQIQYQERQIFEEMEIAFTQFVNDRKWTDDEFSVEERINCNIILTLDPKETQPAAGLFAASVQVLSSRPVYGTDYQTVVFNFADRDWLFEYQPNQPLQFNENTFSNNITSLLAYYAYTIIAYDYDTFSELGGTRFHQIANQIVNNAQSSNYIGWNQFNSVRNRYWLNENLLNSTFEPLRRGLYLYHLKGLDLFGTEPEQSRTNILQALTLLQTSNRSRPRAIATITFLDSKAEELTEIFKEGTPTEKKQAYDILRGIDPARTEVFKKMLD